MLPEPENLHDWRAVRSPIPSDATELRRQRDALRRALHEIVRALEQPEPDVRLAIVAARAAM
jgi:hypothetical protein